MVDKATLWRQVQLKAQVYLFSYTCCPFLWRMEIGLHFLRCFHVPSNCWVPATIVYMISQICCITLQGRHDYQRICTTKLKVPTWDRYVTLTSRTLISPTPPPNPPWGPHDTMWNVYVQRGYKYQRHIDMFLNTRKKTDGGVSARYSNYEASLLPCNTRA